MANDEDMSNIKADVADNALITSELNGRLIRVINVDDLKGYLSYRSTDTGHIIFTRQNAGSKLEYHILIIYGKPVAAYSESSLKSGAALIEDIIGKPGVIEYYFLEEQIIHYVLDKYPQVATMGVKKPEKPVTPVEKKADEKAGQDQQQKAPAVVNTITSIGNEVSEKPAVSEAQAVEAKPQVVNGIVAPDPEPVAPKPEPVVKSETSATPDHFDKENDEDFVKTVETEFVSNVDELLKRLKLTHLKISQNAKK